MKNTFGNNLTVTIFGESHGPFIGAVLDGLAPGITIDKDFINHQLDLRRPRGKTGTQRHEADEYVIASGSYEGKTTGTPLTIIIPNTVQKSTDYKKTEHLARPGHADYAAYCKYHGFEDFNGGGHFSGRITAALVAAAAVVIPALNKKGIYIGSHVKALANVKDADFDQTKLKEQIDALNNKTFATIDSKAETDMTAVIEAAAADLDSVGGILETAVIGMPAGVGEPWFDTLESMLAHALFAVPAVKGVQFGNAFEKVCGYGSEYNDPLRVEDGKIVTKTNNNAGINGGISNGMPIMFSCAVKPTPSIYKKQETVDYINKVNKDIEIQGRHDPAIIHRARVVVDSVTAIVIYDCLAGRFGTDYFLGN